MLCSFSCTLLLEEWKNSLWINKGIFIFFLGLNCLASFLPKWQRVLNNSCKQSLILPSPSPLLRGTPSSVTIKLAAAGCVLELPKLKSRRSSAKVSLMGAGLFVCKAPSAPLHFDGGMCSSCSQPGSLSGGFILRDYYWQVKRRTSSKRKGHWFLYYTNLLAICPDNTVSWCWMSIVA